MQELRKVGWNGCKTKEKEESQRRKERTWRRKYFLVMWITHS